jgi:hypothetical protein
VDIRLKKPLKNYAFSMHGANFAEIFIHFSNFSQKNEKNLVYWHFMPNFVLLF